MREVIIDKTLNAIQDKYEYNSDTLDRVKYGLESIYINITKLSFITIISIILGIYKSTLLFCIFISGLRAFAYGLHAKKSWQCYISSTICFIVMPYIFSIISISYIQKILLSILCIISFYLYSPADTKKRPIINLKQRKKLKLYSIIVCILYIILIFCINNQLITNMILLSMITESILINPIAYKIFNLPYANYLGYINSGV